MVNSFLIGKKSAAAKQYCRVKSILYNLKQLKKYFQRKILTMKLKILFLFLSDSLKNLKYFFPFKYSHIGDIAGPFYDWTLGDAQIGISLVTPMRYLSKRREKHE